MILKRVYFALAAIGFLAGCNDEAGELPVEFTISHVPASVFSSGFITDIVGNETAANILRTMNPLYTVQQFNWSFGGAPPYYSSYSLANGRVEYAHAAGLTGAGQTVSIVDTGFLASHVEFTGKSIALPPGVAALPVDDHGTSVASILAGVSTNGEIIGVAPGAGLLLGSFGSNTTRTAANNHAAAAGAIVQNNSWGFELDVTSANFQSLFSSGTGNTYYNSILNVAQNAVIVFAASNDETRVRSDIMAALPVLIPSIQNNWVAVINAIPTFTGTDITSGTIISSQCLDAAAWCMAADGNVQAATSTGSTDYDIAVGSSFAAPQVSGAIALLAEAFPGLNAEELRARLLASADNQFYEHSGYVEFAPGLRHGYNSQFGHGFLNMRAALLPIGGSYVPRSSGEAVALGEATILSAGMVGDVISRSLGNIDLVLVDGLGAGFDLPASVLTAQGLSRYDPLGAINDLMAAELSVGANRYFAPQKAFSDYATGQELSFQAEDMRFAMLVPDAQSQNVGLSVTRQFGSDDAPFRIGLSAMYEGAGFVGIQSMLSGEAISGTHAGATWEWGVPLAQNQRLAMSGSFGIALPEGGIGDLDLSPVSYNALKVNYSMDNIWGQGDRVSFGIGLPQAIQSGQASVTLPTARGAGGTVFDTIDVGLAPEGRQIDLSIAYGVALGRQSDLVFQAVRSLNDGNVAGLNSTETTIAWRLEF